MGAGGRGGPAIALREAVPARLVAHCCGSTQHAAALHSSAKSAQEYSSALGHQCHLPCAPQVLIADFFLVLVALAWLGVGVLQAKLSPSDGGSSPLLDLWYPLWPTLWQSAIGLLMAGALVSGGLNWVSSNFGAKK